MSGAAQPTVLDINKGPNALKLDGVGPVDNRPFNN